MRAVAVILGLAGIAVIERIGSLRLLVATCALASNGTAGHAGCFDDFLPLAELTVHFFAVCIAAGAFIGVLIIGFRFQNDVVTCCHKIVSELRNSNRRLNLAAAVLIGEQLFTYGTFPIRFVAVVNTGRFQFFLFNKRMRNYRVGHFLSAELFPADRTINHAVIGTRMGAGCGNVIFHCRFTRFVAFRGNDCLLLDNSLANRANNPIC